MSTPNPRYDANWRIKWQAARLRVEALGSAGAVREMWELLDLQYPTLEAYHGGLSRRLAYLIPAARVAELFPFDASLSAVELRRRADELWRRLSREAETAERVMDVLSHPWHAQPEDLEAFSDPLEPSRYREVQRVNWGGLWGRKSGPSSTIAIAELWPSEAHICFLNDASVVRNTFPSTADTEGRATLQTRYYETVLASRYPPESVSWYQYLSGAGTMGRAWLFRRSALEWMPTRRRRFLGITLSTELADYYFRSESANSDDHFSSVPSVIGHAVLLANDINLLAIDLPN